MQSCQGLHCSPGGSLVVTECTGEMHKSDQIAQTDLYYFCSEILKFEIALFCLTGQKPLKH